MPTEVRDEVAFEEPAQGRTEGIVTGYGWKVGPVMETSRKGVEQCLDEMAAVFAR